jgi:hypothetical protein
MRIHTDVSLERWYRFSLFEQLANVGADVDRAIRWKKNGDLHDGQKAFDRALELLDATIADPKNRKGTLKELLSVREALIDYFMYDNEYQTTEEFWYQYFYDFNYAAAVARGK